MASSKSPFFRSRFFSYGLPFLVTIVGGSFWLKDFSQLRYTFRKQRHVSKEEFQEMLGKQIDIKKVDPEKMLEEVQAETEDNYQMIRGPRPWEDSSQMEEIKKKRAEEGKRNKSVTI